MNSVYCNIIPSTYSFQQPEWNHVESLGIPDVRVKIQEHLSLQRSRIEAIAGQNSVNWHGAYLHLLNAWLISSRLL
jgi:hypothetical protein